MGKFRTWVESVGRYLPDELEQQIRAIAKQAVAIIPQVAHSKEEVALGKISGKRQDAGGKVRRILRTVKVVFQPDKPGRAWDSPDSMLVAINAGKASMLQADEEMIYNLLIHELIHTTDPEAGDLATPERDYSVDSERLAYMSSRHEFDAYLGMINNWVLRSPTQPDQLNAVLSNLAAGKIAGLPPDLTKVGEWMMRMAPPLKKKFMSRVYQAIQMKNRGEAPATPDYLKPQQAAPNMPIPAQPLTGSRQQQ